MMAKWGREIVTSMLREGEIEQSGEREAERNGERE